MRLQGGQRRVHLSALQQRAHLRKAQQMQLVVASEVRERSVHQLSRLVELLRVLVLLLNSSPSICCSCLENSIAFAVGLQKLDLLRRGPQQLGLDDVVQQRGLNLEVERDHGVEAAVRFLEALGVQRHLALQPVHPPAIRIRLLEPRQNELRAVAVLEEVHSPRDEGLNGYEKNSIDKSLQM